MAKRIPFQVYLDEGIHQRLRQAAEKYGVPQAKLVREYIERGLNDEIPLDEDPALQIIGIGESGRGDLAAKHDHYLAEFYRAAHRREMDKQG